MKKLIVLLLAGFAALAPGAARADLLGSTVDGVLNYNSFPTTNFLDPANGYVPSGYGNSTGGPNVVVGSGIEFGVGDGNVLFTFDFSSTGLHVTDTVMVATQQNGFTAIFTDPNFSQFSLVDDTIAGLTVSDSGDILTLTYAGTIPTKVSGSQGVVDVTLGGASTSPAPEPSTLTLLGTGLLGAVGVIRRRLVQSSAKA